MNEKLIYFIWKYSIYRNYSIYDSENTDIQILNPGIQNFDSGPDFLEAKMISGNTKWVGNIEIHLKSSDWYKHGHHNDKAYNNVILQVVAEHDRRVVCENGHVVPVMQIEIDENVNQKYQQFLENKTFIPCAGDFHLVEPLKMNMWLGNILAERLLSKAEFITNILAQYTNSWEDTFYHLLARSFGFKVNSEPFEWLAKSLPLKILAKHHHHLTQLEALLFGQAGFLEDEITDVDYYKTLKDEYQFLKAKYQLKGIEKHLWKFMRIRPTNFPTIRIAQFANLIYKSNALFSKVIKAESIDELKEYFSIETSSFWQIHYQFEKISKVRKKSIGDQSINSILINTVIPVLFVYGSFIDDDKIKERALSFLEDMEPETNIQIKEWKKLGMRVSSAFYSQALIHQKHFYCSKFKCLDCGIGAEILKKQIEFSG